MGEILAIAWYMTLQTYKIQRLYFVNSDAAQLDRTVLVPQLKIAVKTNNEHKLIKIN